MVDVPENMDTTTGNEAQAGDVTKGPDVYDKLQATMSLLEKSVKLKETRLLMGRLLRQTALLRKQLNADVLVKFIGKTLGPSSKASQLLIQVLDKVKDRSAMEEDHELKTVKASTPSDLPEVELYSYLLVLIFLIDQKLYTEARHLADLAIQRLQSFNRRTLDVIGARIYFYYSMAYEATGALADIRSHLMALHRTSVLRHDAIGQETLLNLLLRNYLHYHMYDQAEKFRSKAQKQEPFRSSQQLCRYLYYQGRIQAIQLDYTDAKDCLQQAARKAPAIAYGFRLEVNKWLILVRLLLGDIPERSEFSQPGMSVPLRSYFELTTAVRGGDLKAFRSVAERYQEQFVADSTYNLITRLHHNVIRTGLRRINLAYSKISLKDIAEKLALASVEDAQFIVAKAIRDGAFDGIIDHEGGFVQSQRTADVYSGPEPQAAFHTRIAFCLDLHNEAVKAMRFEPDAYRKQLESAEERKERLAQEQELAKAIAEDDE